MRQTKSFLEQLSECNKTISGHPLNIKAIQKEQNHRNWINNKIERGERIPEDPIKLNKKASTNTHLPGYKARTICNITTATLPVHYEHPDTRLDAPCEMCINRQCPYSMGQIK